MVSNTYLYLPLLSKGCYFYLLNLNLKTKLGNGYVLFSFFFFFFFLCVYIFCHTIILSENQTSAVCERFGQRKRDRSAEERMMLFKNILPCAPRNKFNHL